LKRVLGLVLTVLLLVSLTAAFPASAAAAADYSVIRVKLSGATPPFSFKTNGNYTVLDHGLTIQEGQTYTVNLENGVLNLYLGGTLLASGNSITIKEHTQTGDKVNYIHLGDNGREYRGDMTFRTSGSSAYAYNSVYLEYYLYGVLDGELSNTWPVEALKAQAVAARTYAVNGMNASDSYDVDDTSSSQVYNGYDASNDRIMQAVQATDKQVLTYNGSRVLTYFSASNGGETEIPQHIWTPGTPKAYQKIIEDDADFKNSSSEREMLFFPSTMDTGSNRIKYSSNSVNPATSVAAENYLKQLVFDSFSAEDKGKFGLTADNIVLKGVTAMTANSIKSGHGAADSDGKTSREFVKADATVQVQVTEVATGAVQTVEKPVTIDILNKLVGGSSYKTDKLFEPKTYQLFTVKPITVSDVAGFAIYQTRNGHGIGLSQRGAQQRANDGQDYAQILGFYFPGCDRPQLSIQPPALNPPDVYQYTIKTAVSGSGTVTGANVYVNGNNCTVTAKPDSGKYFAGWFENGQYVTNSQSYTFIVQSARNLEARFATIPVPAVSTASAGYTSINVSWAAVPGATSYEVYRSTYSNKKFSKVKTVSGTSWKDTSKTTGKTYYYKVRAVCGGAMATTYGGYSAVKSGKATPLAPSSIKASSASYNSVKVSWSKVSGATQYSIDRATSQNGSYKNIGYTSSTSYTAKGLKSGTTYYFRVRAYHKESGKKIYGSYSWSINARPIPGTPSSLKASKASSTSIKLSWKKVSGATKYDIYCSDAANGSYSYAGTAMTNSYTFKKLKKGRTYYYKVVALRMEGRTKVFGNWSKAVSKKL
jgi:SpoIID/LytB domain protein